MVITKATAMDVRKNFGAMLNNVQYRHNPVLITKAGKPVAALVDMELFERIKLLRTEFDNLAAELQQAAEGVKQTAVDALIKEARQKSRKRK